jgi:hypothetical protein
MANRHVQSPTYLAIAAVSLLLFFGQLQSKHVFLLNRWQHPTNRHGIDSATNPEAYWLVQCFIILLAPLCGYMAFRRR